MRALLAAAALAALALAPAGRASTPVPWCGTDLSAADRLPDATPGFAVHLIYAFPADGGDRFAEWAPRIAGDVTALEQWWRGQDPTRSPRFDLAPFPCASTFGALDVSRVQLPQSAADLGSIDTVFGRIATTLADPPFAFSDPDKKYLVYYDGASGQAGQTQTCGQGRRGFPEGGRESFAVVYLGACALDSRDELRAYVATHELVHVLNALPESGPPHPCPGDSGHPCDAESDILSAVVSVETGRLVEKVLDAGRDDYYGHGGAWWDVQDSLFLERLDSPDRTPPSAPAALTATSRGDTVVLSWGSSADDVGPVRYRVYVDGELSVETETTRFTASGAVGETHAYLVKATDAVGHLSARAEVRFTTGLGIVDATGRLVRDTVPPPRVTSVRIRRRGRSVVLAWPAVRDLGGLRGYRVAIGGRTVVTVRKAAVELARARVRRDVTIVAVDRAGNAGPPLRIPARRLR